MARTFYADSLAFLRPLVGRMDTMEGEDGGTYRGVFLGTSMALDPCGRYHHCLSPNGATSRCEGFWESLEKAAERLGGWIEFGADPCDVFFCMSTDGSEGETEEDSPTIAASAVAGGW